MNKLLIAMDYDGTYTEDPELWDKFINLAEQAGHRVVFVTMRYPSEPVPLPNREIIYTSRVAKYFHMIEIGPEPDIWIDDKPRWIHESSG